MMPSCSSVLKTAGLI